MTSLPAVEDAIDRSGVAPRIEMLLPAVGAHLKFPSPAH
jgi:hypothetical protein